MRNFKIHTKIGAGWPIHAALLLLGCWIFVFPREKQSSRLELVHSNVSRGVMVNDAPMRILEGDVFLRQDSVELHCESAVYDEQRKLIKLSGSVVLIDGADTLNSRQLDYYENIKKAVARYNVTVRREKQRMSSEYLEYFTETDIVRVDKNVKIFDEENRIHISAKHAEHNPPAAHTFIEGNAYLYQVDTTGTDTIHIYCRRMDYFSGEDKRIIARDSVKIFQGELKAASDSAIYYVDREIAYMEKQPTATQQNSEMFGKSMELQMKDLELQKISVRGGARAISVEDSLLEKENRLEGREIIMYISDRKLQEIWAISNARSFYYIKEEQEDKGINTASADTIKAFFKQSEIDSILVIGGSQGIFYPADYKGQIVGE